MDWSRREATAAERRMNMKSLAVPRGTCSDYERASRLEWLETNGKGGFAMGTVAGVNTRRYHGLLVASLRPPVERHVLLSRIEEVALPDVPLATNAYPGAIHPEGYRNLVDFRLDPFPTWVFDAGGTRIEKSLFLVHGEDTVVIAYRTTRPVRLSIAPFLAFRDYHSLVHANPALDGYVRAERQEAALTLHIRPYGGLPEWMLHTSPEAQFTADGTWYFAHLYEAEKDRGLDFAEDLWKMGTLTVEIRPGTTAFVVASLSRDAIDAAEVARLEAAERERRRVALPDAFTGRLARAAEQYVVRRQDKSPTVIAGYPWFTDWGRDTMIALPGLLLSRGRLEEARDVIRSFLAHRDRGLLPNRFPDRGEAPEYNTVAAASYAHEADAVERAFAKAFWNPARGCLYDVVVGPRGDGPSLRPNQLFALSLPFPLLDSAQRRSVVRVVEKELLTPYGLRTLARGEPGYVNHFRGGPWERDTAYHQGTVWPWLLGPYVRAYLAAFGRTGETLAHCRRLL